MSKNEYIIFLCMLFILKVSIHSCDDEFQGPKISSKSLTLQTPSLNQLKIFINILPSHISIPVQADYYTTLWECYYWPPIHGQWSSWSTANETFQNERTCPGKLSFATQQCDSPSPEYCGMYCGSSSIKVDIFPGTYV